LLVPKVVRKFDEIKNTMKFKNYYLWMDHLKTL